MLDIPGGVKAKIDQTLQALLWAAIAAAAATAGSLFLLVALFIWLAAAYDVLTACVVLGLLLVAVALGATVAFVLVRRPPARRVTPAAARVDAARSDAVGQPPPSADVLFALLAEATDQGRQVAGVVRDAAENVADAFKDTVERRPLTAIAIVLGLGFMFGTKWRRAP